MLELILILLISNSVLGSQVRLKGGQFVTEDGRLYELTSLTIPQIEYAEKILGCSIQCADLCLEVTSGTALLRCYKFCGCQDLISEKPSKIHDLTTQSYFRDVRIDVDLPESKDVEKRKTEIKVTGPTDLQTGSEPKIADIEYEVKVKGPNTIKREFEVKIPQEGKDLKWKYETKTRYGDGFSDSDIEWKEPTKQWNGKGVEHEEHSDRYLSSNTTYKIPLEKGYGIIRKGYEWKVDTNNTENGEEDVYWYHDYLSPKEKKEEFVKANLKHHSNHTDIKTRYTEITHRDQPKPHPSETNPQPQVSNQTHSEEALPQPVNQSTPYTYNSSNSNSSSSDNQSVPEYSEPKEWEGGVDYKYSMSWKGIKSTHWHAPKLTDSFINTLSLHCASKCSEICKESEDKYRCMENCAGKYCEKKVTQEGMNVFTIVIQIGIVVVIFIAVMLKLQRRKVEKHQTEISPESRTYYHKL